MVRLWNFYRKLWFARNTRVIIMAWRVQNFPFDDWWWLFWHFVELDTFPLDHHVRLYILVIPWVKRHFNVIIKLRLNFVRFWKRLDVVIASLLSWLLWAKISIFHANVSRFGIFAFFGVHFLWNCFKTFDTLSAFMKVVLFGWWLGSSDLRVPRLSTSGLKAKLAAWL